MSEAENNDHVPLVSPGVNHSIADGVWELGCQLVTSISCAIPVSVKDVDFDINTASRSEDLKMSSIQSCTGYARVSTDLGSRTILTEICIVDDRPLYCVHLISHEKIGDVIHCEIVRFETIDGASSCVARAIVSPSGIDESAAIGARPA